GCHPALRRRSARAPRFELRCFPLSVPPAPVIYPLSLHDALPISEGPQNFFGFALSSPFGLHLSRIEVLSLNGIFLCHYLLIRPRSEEHTSELQSRENLVCRLLLEKKNTTRTRHTPQPQAAPAPAT